MKLHLPSGLRKSLLACLAALALPVTLSSGSAFLFGATCSISLSSSALAAYTVNDDEEEWLDGQNPADGENEVIIGNGKTLTIKAMDENVSYSQSFNVQAGGTLVLDNRGAAPEWNVGDETHAASKGRPMVISGALSGSGNVAVVGRNDYDFIYNRNHPGVQLHGENFAGTLTLDNAVVDLTGNLQVAGLFFEDSIKLMEEMYLNSENVVRKSSNVEEDVEFSFYVAQGDTVATAGRVSTDERGRENWYLEIQDGVTFVKTGAGTLELDADAIYVHDMEIRQGRLRLYAPIFSYSGRFIVDGAQEGVLELTNTWQSSSSAGVMELRNGGIVEVDLEVPEYEGGYTFTISNMELGSGGGVLKWDDNSQSSMRYVIQKLSSVADAQDASLIIESSSTTASKSLEIDRIFNFNGSVVSRDSSVELGENPLRATGLARAGWIEQQLGYHATVTAQSLLVYNFRKLGLGSFSVVNSDGEAADMRVGGGGSLWMNYEGDLNYRDISFVAAFTLIYTSCDEDKTLSLSYDSIAESYGSNVGRSLDLSRVERSSQLADPEKGICLGIWTETTNEDELARYIELLNFEFEGYDASLLDVNYRWEKQDSRNYLWLSVDLTDEAKVGRYWDTAWGLRSLGAPGEDKLSRVPVSIRNENAGGTQFETEVGYLFRNDTNSAQWGGDNANYTAKFFNNTEGEFTTVGNTLQLAFSSDIGLPSMSGSWMRQDPHVRWETGHTSQATGNSGPHYFAFNREFSVTAVRLAAGSSTASSAATATVLGGRLYTQDDADDAKYASHRNAWFLEDWASYISLAGDANTRYHLLVGGSSCVGTREGATGSDGVALGGFQGATHIQVGTLNNGAWTTGGTVDYIVGGNHVNNSAFTFQGSSYISIMRGDVVGGIVGGSTLTKGTDNTNLYTFNGSSNIYIYTPLRNTGVAPGISDGTTSASGIAGESGKGAAFTAVVGGNAWIDVPHGATTQQMNPTFHGVSNIVVDISEDAVLGRSFDKDIVGGNFTAYTGTVDGAGERNTIFEGESSILITAADSVVFNGMINGASRRASGGAGITHFIGDTLVRIGGGQYTNLVAGGMAFDEGATGDHAALLNGHTQVELNSGAFWRVAGGSVSFGGGSSASEDHTGNSNVLIRGGSFGVEHIENAPVYQEQKDMAFVAGGSFFRGNLGGTGANDEGHTHNGNSSVVIDPTTATLFSGVHIVGGDYVNASSSRGVSNGIIATISGNAGVRIGSTVNNEGAAQIEGLVAGGSWLTDSDRGGKVSLGSTSVEIYSGRVAAQALSEDGEAQDGRDADSGHYHGGIAVVGGNVLIDEDGAASLGSGSHTAEVKGATAITIGSKGLDGPTVVGHVVGGSYTTQADGRNTLSSGSVSISINSGSIEGNIYGGHYSQNSSSPDTLALGDVSIEMNGGSVTGDIVGGGYRSTNNDSQSHLSTQGTITISLEGGSLEGNVYAAGWNDAMNGSANTETTRTEVHIGSDFKISSQAQTTISGGYGRTAGSNVMRGSVGSALLDITGANQSITAAVNAGRLTFTDFSEVSIADGMELAVSTNFVVLRTAAVEAENVFIKSGDGLLSVNGLSIRNSADNDLLNFEGRLVVNGGSLHLQVSRNITPGLGFGLSTLGKHGSLSSAYLQAEGGLLIDANSKVPLVFTGTAEDLAAVDYGTYYLATGLGEEVTDDVHFAYDIEALNLGLENLGSNRYLQLRVVEGNLVMMVRDTADRNLFFWEGVDSTVWTDSDRDAWSEHRTAPPAASPAGHNVYFESIDSKVVTVDGIVTPRSIWVQKGDFTITGNDGASLNVGGGKNEVDLGSDNKPLARQLGVSELAVGGEGRDAHLTLQLSAKRLDYALLKDRGTLTLDVADAILTTGANATKIAFQGGVLEYGDSFSADVSDQVQALGDGAQDSTGRVRVSVAAAGGSATWGSAAAGVDNPGIALALNQGMDKLGAGTFIMEWAAQAGSQAEGRIRVSAGELIYRVHAGGSNSVAGLTLTNAAPLEVQSGATLTLEVVGAGRMDIERAFSGSGTVRLSKTAGSSSSFAPFNLKADNGDFTGTLVLAGNSSAGMADVVQVDSGAALGGLSTRLTLAGLSIMLPSSYAPRYTTPSGDDDPDTFVSERLADIQVRRINVSEGTVNYIGGTALRPEGNADIYIRCSELTGSGTLSNAWGTGSFAYRHTFEGSLSGFSGTIVAGDARSKTVGTSSAATLSSWTLVDAGGGDLLANFAGNGSIIFNFESARATRLLGRIGDAAAGTLTTLENVGASELILAGGMDTPNTATGSLITHSGRKVGIIRLGDNELEGTWAGKSLRGDGTFTLTNGALINGINSKDSEAKLLVETMVRHNNNPNVSTSVDIGGTSGALLDGITITAGGRLSGVGEDINVGSGLSSAGRPIKGLSASLTFGRTNIAEAPEPKEAGNYLIEMNGGSVIVNDPANLRLDFTNDAFAAVLESMTEPGADGEANVAWLHLVAGGKLQIAEPLYDQLLAVSKDSENGTAALLGVLGFRVAGVDGGDLGLAGRTNEAYIVWRNEGEAGDKGNDPTVPPVDSDGHGYGILSAYTSTIVTAGKTLTINLTDKPENETGEVSAEALSRDIAAGGALVNNLVGMAGSALVVNNVRVLDLGEDEELDLTDSANRVSVVLNNTANWEALIGSEPAQNAAGLDTSFEGTISAGAGVDMVKSGKGTLTIGAADGQGGLQLAGGDMRLIEGGLTLQGNENALRSLTFAYSAPVDGAPYEDRTVTLSQGRTSVGSLVEDGTNEARRGGDILLEQGAELVLTGRSFISDSVIRQGDGELGTLTVDSQGELTLGGLASEDEPMVAAADSARPEQEQLQGIKLHLKSGGVLDMALSSGTVSNLYGGGVLTGSGGVLNISGAEAGAFSGSMQGVGALHVMKGGKLSFHDAVGGSAWAVDNAGVLVINLESNTQDLTLGAVTLRSGSTTQFFINSDKGEDMSVVNADLFVVEKGAKVEVHSEGAQIITTPELTLAHVSSVPSRSDVELAEVSLHGISFLHYQKTAKLYMSGNDLVIGLQISEQNDFITPGMHKNALAGANLFWEATDTATSESWERISKDKNSDLYKMAAELYTLREEGRIADLNRSLAAGAGASASVLGGAIAQDVERQLRSIRNRTTTMGSELRYDGNNELPLYHMWINGESSYHKMSADGLAPGYTLNSWGGTVGMDADVSANSTVGLALSAMYGDLKTSSPDAAHGDTTTTYLSGFARVSSGAWMHTFIVTAGFADVKLDRTVSYGSGSYNTRGHTNGYQLGALYEIGYSRALNKQGTSVLQGVANVEVRHVDLGGYSELNTEAGLRVDDISHDVITFGVGARLQSVVAENALNRASIFEARALVKADAGDRSSTATTSLIHGSATRQEVESAELGVLGLELGAGLTVPVGGKGACFIDASAELRSGYTELNANVGYRMSF